ncbi:hypothetical protein B9N43_02110 [Denitratisoma sp. DHT3]|uniref:hypothetical protein n=1 Tax=Denitratisoma sp. DHT3 TaxID=1981880 RepID=UPI00119853E7|nr:hypothetical protein [Denitratisoma sp. DHT3]QDX80157.1 hypothetical protein B9N43_02110 [Denitratisoma sp. DHT3]
MSFDRGQRTYQVSDERLRAFAALTPAERLRWVEELAAFLRLAHASRESAVAPATLNPPASP